MSTYGLRQVTKLRHKKSTATREGGRFIFLYDMKWLPTVDTLRNLFDAPTVDMKVTLELLRQVH